MAYGGAAPALADVDFERPAGSSLCVLGPNGGGKTTLFRALTGRADAAARRRSRRTAAPAVPRPDRAHAARLPRERARRRAHGLAGPRALVAAAAARRPRRRARRPRARRARGPRRRPLRRAVRRPAPARAARPRARPGRPRCCCSTSRSPASTPPARSGSRRCSRELRAEGRTLLVSTHDVDSARAFDRVLCLNRRQVAFGPPRALTATRSRRPTGARSSCSTTSRRPGRAVAVQHHEH